MRKTYYELKISNYGYWKKPLQHKRIETQRDSTIHNDYDEYKPKTRHTRLKANDYWYEFNYSKINCKSWKDLYRYRKQYEVNL